MIIDAGIPFLALRLPDRGAGAGGVRVRGGGSDVFYHNMFRRHPALGSAAPSALLRKLQKHLPSGTPVSSVQFGSRWYLSVGKAHNCALYAIFRKSVAAALSQFEAVEMQVGI